MSSRKQKVFETPFNQYTATAVIGEGGAGRVYKVTGDDNKAFAIKLLYAEKATHKNMKRFQNEVDFCSRNSHPNIIAVLDSGNVIDGKKDSPFYIMPLYTTSLRKLLKARISPEKVLYYYSQLLDGVEAAHLLHVVHRDLKPENILYDEIQDRLLVADFGIAHFEVEDLYTAAETSPNDKLANFQYASPEQRTRGAKVEYPADIYALGLILNEMFTGLIPHGTRYKTISDVAPDYDYLDDMVTEMLDQSGERRTNSIAEVKHQLIGRGVEFARLQRLNKLKQTVVPVTDIDDPLINDPPILCDAKYIRGVLHLDLSHPVNDKWIRALHNMGSFSSMGKRPEHFDILGDRASTRAEEQDVQRIVDFFKEWLLIANRKYEQMIRNERREEEERQRRELQMEIEELERQKRVRGSLRI
ncbi:MAG: serine/threonine protein kinase [Ktedonobacteraceae bacterium]